MNSLVQLKKLVSGYVHLEESIVRDVAEMKRQKIKPFMIESVCKEKVTAIWAQSFSASNSMGEVIRMCTGDIEKKLRELLERELNR